jgi:hypothetical protein
VLANTAASPAPINAATGCGSVAQGDDTGNGQQDAGRLRGQAFVPECDGQHQCEQRKVAKISAARADEMVCSP